MQLVRDLREWLAHVRARHSLPFFRSTLLPFIVVETGDKNQNRVAAEAFQNPSSRRVPNRGPSILLLGLLLDLSLDLLLDLLLEQLIF